MFKIVEKIGITVLITYKKKNFEDVVFCIYNRGYRTSK